MFGVTPVIRNLDTPSILLAVFDSSVELLMECKSVLAHPEHQALKRPITWIINRESAWIVER